MDQYWHLNEEDLFSGLPASVRNAFLQLATLQEARKGDLIFRENDPGSSCYYIERGTVRIFRVDRDANESLISIRKKGELFGLAELFEDRARKGYAQAIAPCIVRVLTRQAFVQLLSTSPEFSCRIIATMGQRIRKLGAQIESLMNDSVTDRILKLLVRLSIPAIRQAKSSDTMVDVPVKLSQNQIAQMVGSCQQTVSEVFAQLQDEGLICIEHRQIRLLDAQRLLDRFCAPMP